MSEPTRIEPGVISLKGARTIVSARLTDGDHMVTIREAVAEVQRELGMEHIGERILAGELDGQPMMRAAIAAVERVLKGMFGA